MSAPASAPVTPRKDSADLNSLKVVELRAELSLRHLSPKGLKKDLVKRLADALERETGPAQPERALGVPRDDVDKEGVEGEDEGHDKEDADAEGEEGTGEDSPDGPGAGGEGGPGVGGEGGPDAGGARDADAPADPARPTAKDSSDKSAGDAAGEPEYAPEDSQQAEKGNAAEGPVADEPAVSMGSEPDQGKHQRKAVEQPSPSPRFPSPAKPSQAKGIKAGEEPAGRRSPAKDGTATSPQRTPQGKAKPAAAEDAAEQPAEQQMAETEPAAEDATRKRGREPESAAVYVLPVERPRNENVPEPSTKRTRTEEEKLDDVQMTDAAAVVSGPSRQTPPAPVSVSDESVVKDCVGKASTVAASLGPPAGAQKTVPEKAGGLAEAATKKKRAFSPIKPPSPVKSSPPPPTTKSARPASGSTGRSPGVAGTKGKADASEDASEDASVAQQSTSAPKFAESATIFILGLHRPFTNPALKRMLEEHGTVEYFWIDNIKSHCYVTFSDLPSAILARSQIHDTVWPPQTGHKLTVDFITTERMRVLVEEEEKEQQARRRVRVVESADPDVVLVVEDISTVRHKPASFGLASTAAPPSSDATPGSEAARRTSGGGILSRLGGLAPPAPAQSSANAAAAAAAAAEQPHKDPHRHDPEAVLSWRNSAAPDSSAPSKASAPKHVPPDQIFQKTETKPQLYYLPLTDKQVAEKLRCREP